MTKKSGRWVQSVKCYMCGKTGKIQDPENPDNEKKCLTCAGTGFITTSGILSA